MGSFFIAKIKAYLRKTKKCFCYVFYALILMLTVINPVSIKTTPAQSCSKACSATFPSIEKIIRSLFNRDKKKDKNICDERVYLGGYPLGFTLNLNGVLVVAISNDNVKNLKEGDIIQEIENIKINTVDDISNILNNQIQFVDYVDLTINRKGETEQAKIKPVFDENLNRFKLGLWIRDNSAGVGTLTYIKKSDLRFGALGHPVCDIDTGSLMDISNGNIYKCNIVGLKKGTSGTPGELKGLFLRNGNIYGTLDKNATCGVFGNFYESTLDQIDKKEVLVASRNEIKSGKAKIRCTVDGYEPCEYDIEIVKVYFNTTNNTKSMFIRVIDKDLIEKTGGIVQGMSGSPIIQNGKLIGAVTHVFVSDPTKGYGIFADEMIKN